MQSVVDLAMGTELDMFVAPLASGCLVSLQVFSGAAALGVPLGMLCGLVACSPQRWPRVAVSTYVLVFRGTSALVQLFWAYYVLPLLGVELDALLASILVLGLNTGAYGTEIVRGAVRSVPLSQWEAAHALGFSRWFTLRRIVLPQAAATMVPPWTNLLIELLKATALVSLVTLADLSFEARVLRDHTLRSVEIFGLVLLLYFCGAALLSRAMGVLERRAKAFRGAHATSRV